jgi:serine/threonine protein kinase
MAGMSSLESPGRDRVGGVLAAGWVLGRYEIVRLLSVGGMAEIYLARSAGIAGFEKRVVVKRMLPQFAAHSTYVEMFLGEARLAATLDHPNIAQVHDIGESTGDYYYAMEYVAGVDLRAILQEALRRRQRVPIPIVIAIGRGMCAGLDHAHSRTGGDGRLLGIVHRDVSLSNILVSYDGSVKVTDFGVAKVAADNSQTRAGMLKGKLGYMSPEQVQGKPLDRRSDVFAIGIVLWELIAGRRLFAGDAEFAVLQRIVEGVVPPLSTVRADVPPALEAAVMRALASDRDLRYPSARDLQRDLEAFARDHRVASSDLEVAEYMGALFPPELRHSDSLGYAVGDDEPSMEVEISDPGGAIARARGTLTQQALSRTRTERRQPTAPVSRMRTAAIVISCAGLAGVGYAVVTRGQPAPDETPVAPAPVAAAAPAAAPDGAAPPPVVALDAPPAIEPPPAAALVRAERTAEVAPARTPSRSGRERARVPEPARPPRPAPAAPAIARAAAPPVEPADADAALPPREAEPPAAPPIAAPVRAPDAGVPPAKAAPKVVPRGSLDAVAAIRSVDVDGSLQGSVVRHSVSRATDGFRECYRQAARTAQRTPAGQVSLTFEIDETGLVRNVRASGGPLPGIATCVRGATERIRSRVPPDVGVARATVVIAFEPTAP